MITDFSISVNYTQVLTYLRHIDRPGLLWSDDHVAQGFAWNPGLVSFGVPDHDGECLVEVNTDANLSDLRVDTSLWAIEVPFDADETEIQVGTVLDDRTCIISEGSYHLVFEAHTGEIKGDISYTYIVRFNFIKASQGTFAILKQGSLLSGTVLTTTAQRA